MKETKFIQQNRKKWKEFEDLSRSKHKDSNTANYLYKLQMTSPMHEHFIPTVLSGYI